jgi:hypothetical protein
VLCTSGYVLVPFLEAFVRRCAWWVRRGVLTCHFPFGSQVMCIDSNASAFAMCLMVAAFTGATVFSLISPVIYGLVTVDFTTTATTTTTTMGINSSTSSPSGRCRSAAASNVSTWRTTDWNRLDRHVWVLTCNFEGLCQR